MISSLLFVLVLVAVLAVSLVMALLRGIFGFFVPGRKNGQKGFSGQDGNNQDRFRWRRKKEGEVSIDYIPPKKDLRNARPAYSAKEEEYIDFEEVKDEPASPGSGSGPEGK